jgi:hypothetical protein
MGVTAQKHSERVLASKSLRILHLSIENFQPIRTGNAQIFSKRRGFQGTAKLDTFRHRMFVGKGAK